MLPDLPELKPSPKIDRRFHDPTKCRAITAGSHRQCSKEYWSKHQLPYCALHKISKKRPHGEVIEEVGVHEERPAEELVRYARPTVPARGAAEFFGLPLEIRRMVYVEYFSYREPLFPT